MIAFPGMLVTAAQEAGMSVPPDPENFSGLDYPHFYALFVHQLGKPVRFPGEHWHNAKIVAQVPDDRIREVTLDDLIELGFSY